jgi:hypothetical protein
MQADMRYGRRAPARRRRSRTEQVQNRRFVLAVCLLALMVVVTAAVSYSSRAEATRKTTPVASSRATATTLDPAASLVSATYTAELQGDAAGSASKDPRALLTLAYDAAAQTLSYELRVTSPLTTPCVAAICQATPGQGGATLFTMFPGPAVAGNFSGILSEGGIAAEDLVGPLKGGRLTDLILLFRSGGAYATIGTASHPVDAIRGQIK